MKLYPFTVLLFVATNCCAQDLVSVYRPKTKTEKLVINQLKSLPEIKDLYARRPGKDYKFDVMINPPDSEQKDYRFQVGTDHPDRFATNYWLSIDPKTLQVFYEDFDDEGVQDITLEKWRYWRRRPEFQKRHKWVKGNLVVLKDEKHGKTKSR
ncbi:MAG: hypothetical protein JSU01_09930 [Bacteroidetes bacterium]|nr:hypothetical protein [Bacteroidota bacterium]